MKKTLSLLLCIVMLTSLLVCGSVSASASDAEDYADDMAVTADKSEPNGASNTDVQELIEQVKSAPIEESELAQTGANVDLAKTAANLDDSFYAYVTTYLGGYYLSYDSDDYDNVIAENRDNNTRRQLWCFIHLDDNSWVIMNGNTGQLLEVSGGSAQNNANIWTNNLITPVPEKQRWHIYSVTVGDKYYYQFCSALNINYNIERESEESNNIELYKEGENGVSRYALFSIKEIPVITEAEAVSNGVKVSWESSYNNVRYSVFRQEYPFVNWQKLGNTSAYSYTDKTVKPGKVYYYTVRCIDANGYFVSDYDRRGAFIRYFSIPALKYVTSNKGYMKVAWSGGSFDEDGSLTYYVFRKTGSSGWKRIASTKNDYYNDKNVSYGTNYTYTVRIYDTNNKVYCSYFNTKGRSLKYYNKYYCETPVLKSVENTTAGVCFKWADSQSNCDYYYIFRKIGSGSWAKVARVSKKVKVYNDKNVKSGYKYTYTVRKVYKGQYVSDFNAKGKAVLYIAAPKVTSVQNTYSGIRINWTKSNGAAKYRVFRKTYNAKTKKWSAWAVVGETSNTYGIDTKVSNNVRYAYTVRCMNSAKTAYTSAYYTSGTAIVRSY